MTFSPITSTNEFISQIQRKARCWADLSIVPEMNQFIESLAEAVIQGQCCRQSDLQRTSPSWRQHYPSDSLSREQVSILYPRAIATVVWFRYNSGYFIVKAKNDPSATLIDIMFDAVGKVSLKVGNEVLNVLEETNWMIGTWANEIVQRRRELIQSHESVDESRIYEDGQNGFSTESDYIGEDDASEVESFAEILIFEEFQML